MAKAFIQTSFNSGEWAPHLWARVDLEKYHSGAAVLENFFVDYRGGASTRSGSKWVLRGYRDSKPIRLIGFQAAISVGFVLEFGDLYLRFHRNGSPVLETALAITAATQANPCHVTAANNFSAGDWVFISGVAGMTQLNGKYYILSNVSGAGFDLNDLFGNPVNSTGYSPYTSGGTVARVYTIATPYAAEDLALLKFVQNVDVLILCHPNYGTQVLTFNTATNWVMSAAIFGATVLTPTGGALFSTLGAGTWDYAYVVTAIDSTGQESIPSPFIIGTNLTDMRTTAGTNTISWTAVSGAVSYNVYKSIQSQSNPVPVGVSVGFIGNCTGTSFNDSNIVADFSQGPPVAGSPFLGGGVATLTLTAMGAGYITIPSATIAVSPLGVTATTVAYMGLNSFGINFAGGGAGFNIGNKVHFPYGIVMTVTGVSGPGGFVTAMTIDSNGHGTFNGNVGLALPGSLTGTGGLGGPVNIISLDWGVYNLPLISGGSGYTSTPAVTISGGTPSVPATATATLNSAQSGSASVPSFFQQRLVLAGPTISPETLFFSQTGNYFNYNTSNPIEDDDAITASIVTGQLSNIKALIPQPGGLIVLTDGISYLINGGSLGSAVTPVSITANPQSYIGANDMPPIVVNYDMLTVPAKGSSVRDNTYNFYANVFTGQDISAYSSHLFFGFQLKEWAWVEEPYKNVWAVRNDGVMLSLTFIKEQEFIAWSHHETDGDYKSVCTIVESATVGFQNFLYSVVSRTINGTPVQYIEYFPERPVSDNAQDYWTVDCAIGYSGSPTSTFQGAEFLAGKTVTGLADGVPITPFVMPTNGDFTLPAPASNVKVGLAFTCDLQTLFIDLGNTRESVVSKEKQIPQVTLRVTNTLGLKIGTDADNLVTMKDLVLGNVGSMTNQVVTGLVTGDARTILDPKWQEPGQVYIRQDQPYPASILGYVPQVNSGQDK